MAGIRRVVENTDKAIKQERPQGAERFWLLFCMKLNDVFRLLGLAAQSE